MEYDRIGKVSGSVSTGDEQSKSAVFLCNLEWRTSAEPFFEDSLPGTGAPAKRHVAAQTQTTECDNFKPFRVFVVEKARRMVDKVSSLSH
jgi:hypothetical protein